MIDLTTLTRVRLSGGTLIHAITPPGGSTTACGKRALIGVDRGRRDEPLPPHEAVTCRRCHATPEDGR